VDPLAPNGTVSFKDRVVVALYLEGQNDPLQMVTIKKGNEDVRKVTFTDVQLPELDSGTGTYKLSVRAQSAQ
jgi:hypothetical protein